MDTQLANPRRVGRPGGVRVRAQALRSVGLIGWGERTVPPRVPGWMRDRLARVPVDPATGRPEVAIRSESSIRCGNGARWVTGFGATGPI
ncbi:hypothetical protein ACFLIM_15795 [Nonomuraea sp. M3C6]|uniref:Uncharacterized protein n=1 Tax=Nonomuraea marmarensis TaxID=3351344 RepID=A0ABW7ABB2_9ACTN